MGTLNCWEQKPKERKIGRKYQKKLWAIESDTGKIILNLRNCSDKGKNRVKPHTLESSIDVLIIFK